MTIAESMRATPKTFAGVTGGGAWLFAVRSSGRIGSQREEETERD